MMVENSLAETTSAWNQYHDGDLAESEISAERAVQISD